MRRDDVVKRCASGVLVIALSADAAHDLGARLHLLTNDALLTRVIDWMPAEDHSHDREPDGDWRRERRAVSATSSDLFEAFTFTVSPS